MSPGKDVALFGGTATETVAAICRGLSHPTRVRVLLAFRLGEYSPAQLSRNFDDPRLSLPALAYHVRGLAGAGLIELAGTTARGVMVEHSYVLTRRGHTAIRAVESMAAG
jgi:DNA-binding transcriptional ArsR family regulator